jgi:hypothetical protein
MQALSNNLADGWSYTFTTTAVIADNTFQVHTYAAQAPRPPASNDDAFTLNGSCPAHTCTGSQFVFNYGPTGDDPTANIHWVQILYDNYLLNGTRRSRGRGNGLFLVLISRFDSSRILF